MPSATDIELIMRSLTNIGSESTPSEAHGVLCGLLCGDEKVQADEWIAHLAYDFSSADLLAEEAHYILARLYHETTASLTDNNLKFHPLLAENEDVIVSLEAIAQWAQGFLMGLSLSGVKDLAKYPENVTEFVEAMASISDAASYDLANDESDEEAIIELIEFIRMGVLLINEEMNPIRVPVDIQNSETSIH